MPRAQPRRRPCAALWAKGRCGLARQGQNRSAPPPRRTGQSSKRDAKGALQRSAVEPHAACATPQAPVRGAVGQRALRVFNGYVLTPSAPPPRRAAKSPKRESEDAFLEPHATRAIAHIRARRSCWALWSPYSCAQTLVRRHTLGSATHGEARVRTAGARGRTVLACESTGQQKYAPAPRFPGASPHAGDPPTEITLISGRCCPGSTLQVLYKYLKVL
jgi:hypothetical protein